MNKKTLEKTLTAARLELGEYFGHGAIFYDWEKEFGIFSPAATAPVKFAEEIPTYYKKVEDVIKAVLETAVQDRYDLFEYQPEDVEHNSYVKGEEFNKILNSLPLDKILMNYFNSKR